MGGQSFVVILGLVFIGFIFFCIYFIFKILQFVIQATNLYKDMVVRQDMTIKLLKDIRDSGGSSGNKQNNVGQNSFCTKCGEKNSGDAEKCTSCGAKMID